VTGTPALAVSDVGVVPARRRGAAFVIGYSGRYVPPPDLLCRAIGVDPVGVFERLRRRALGGDSRVPELAPAVARMAALRPAFAEEARAVIAAGPHYAAALGLARRFVAAVDAEARARRPGLPVEFLPKAGAELEPLVALFPDVIVFPTMEPLDLDYLVGVRVAPIHPLGVALAPRFADGAWMSPLEYLMHDVDHVRFMVREELRSRGVDLPDAYQPLDGGPPTTLVDAERGLHRTILDGSGPKVAGARLGDRACLRDRARLARALRRSRTRLPREQADAIRLMLFEIVHEKGFPLDGEVLRREVAGDRHARKLCDKLRCGFYGARLRPAPSTIALLDWARGWIGARA
jgi:hypothetical protein